jgi:predicted GIY-YIG superfamily endonuclease
MAGKKKWSVYMVRCADKTLYTGISNNVQKRVAAHNAGKGARYIIPSRRPVKLIYIEDGYDVGSALKRERVVKNSGKTAKEKLAGKGRGLKNYEKREF